MLRAPQQQPPATLLPETVRDPVATPENLVCTANVGTQLNLEQMIVNLRVIGGELNKGKFAAIILRFAKESLYPRATLLVFSSGKMVCTGCKCVEGAILVMTKVVTAIRELCGIRAAELRGFRVQNVVGCLRLNVPIDLDELRSNVLPASSYEPSSFPGVIYKSEKIAFLIFMPGSAVITGATSLEAMQQAARFIAPLLYRARLMPRATEASATAALLADAAAARRKRTFSMLERALGASETALIEKMTRTEPVAAVQEPEDIVIF